MTEKSPVLKMTCAETRGERLGERLTENFFERTRPALDREVVVARGGPGASAVA